MNLSTESEVKAFLKNYAPFSILDRGLSILSLGGVNECAKSGTKIIADVTENSENFSVSLDLFSGNKIRATCTCCTPEDIEEQWCQHLVASVWQAWKLDFLSPTSGFLETESEIRMNQKNPDEIAEILERTAELKYQNQAQEFYPDVKIELNLEEDRLGVKVFYDNVIQTAQVFEEAHNRSSRELDNILIQILEDEGVWDEEESIWYINTSHSISIVLGLIQEYKNVLSFANSKKIIFSQEPLNSLVTAEWHATSLELIMYWVINSKRILKTNNIIGTGPFWTLVDNKIYKLSPTSAYLASIFPYSSTVTLSRQQAGSILEVLTKNLIPKNILEIVNPDKQPDTVIKTPKPVLKISKKENYHTLNLDSDNSIDLVANLDFQYPDAPKGKNIIYLPDREKETNYIDFLASLGFVRNLNSNTYFISGDDALDLLSAGDNIFADEWEVIGLNEIKQQLKFSNLKLNLEITDNKDEDNDKKINWFDCKISLLQNNANVPISLIFKNINNPNNHWIKLDNGAWAKIPGGGVKQLKTTLGMISNSYDHSNNIKAKLNIAQALSLNGLKDDLIEIKANKTITELNNKVQNFTTIKTINPPALFEGKLRIYQKEGLSWLSFLNDFKLGGILADEMGLGKTVQTLALLQALKSKNDKEKKTTKPSLIIAPTSVTTNWLYETRRFTPKLKPLLLSGSKRKKLFDEIPNHDVVITSYALLRVDRAELERFDFSYVILDEAQNIKNPQTSTAKAAKALKSENRLALSGTPTENRPLELWSLFDFLMPGYLGSHKFFEKHIEKPILEGAKDNNPIALLNAKTKPFILRRLKSEVEKQLPPKIESEMFVAMTESQQELYAKILEEVRPQVMDAVEQKGIRGASISILAALLRLRQVCNHPNSIDGLKNIQGYDSGKFELLKELVSESIDSGKKILLFSQFREMLAIIRRWLDESKINHLYLDGATKERQNLVDQFNTDERVRLFLISLKAGGTGLNLTGADTVIIYDPWWNPAVESQAVDRAHRIGQSKNVNVYRLVTEDSIEQKIMELKAKKTNIIDALINENGLSGLNLSKNDLESLFSPLKKV